MTDVIISCPEGWCAEAKLSSGRYAINGGEEIRTLDAGDSSITGEQTLILLLAPQLSQQPIHELRRIAQQRRLVRQLLLELAQRLDERAALGQRLLDQLARFLLAHRRGQQEGRALSQHRA